MIATTAHPYLRLMRIDRPIGTWLLLWPTLAALWVAAEGVPPLGILAAFVVGTFVMRAAGCVVNDIADRRLDRHVARTASRPLATGEVSVRQALVLFVVLIVVAGLIAATLNRITLLTAAAGVLVVVVYPFCKRWTHLPQCVLGVAFSWGILMAFTAVTEAVGVVGWLLFLASAAWIVAYDTIYAMVDRDDDVAVGIKSTAVLFRRHDRLFIGVLQGLTLILLLVLAVYAGFGLPFYLGLGGMGLSFVYQQVLLRRGDKDAWMRAFRHNAWAGFALFLGCVAMVGLAF